MTRSKPAPKMPAEPAEAMIPPLGFSDCATDALPPFLAALREVPPAWDRALREFSRAPSLRAWQELVHEVPDDELYPRCRASIARLEELGVHPDMLLECAAYPGIFPDAFRLAETGAASPEAVLARGRASRLPGFWVALAAHAAAARGDFDRAVQLAKKARREATIDLGLVDLQICRLASLLDDAHREQLQ